MLPAAEVPTRAGGQEAALGQDGMRLAAPTHDACYVQECGVGDVAGGCVLTKGVEECVGGVTGVWCCVLYHTSCITGVPLTEVSALSSVTGTGFVGHACTP